MRTYISLKYVYITLPKKTSEKHRKKIKTTSEKDKNNINKKLNMLFMYGVSGYIPLYLYTPYMNKHIRSFFDVVFIFLMFLRCFILVMLYIHSWCYISSYTWYKGMFSYKYVLTHRTIDMPLIMFLHTWTIGIF